MGTAHEAAPPHPGQTPSLEQHKQNTFLQSVWGSPGLQQPLGHSAAGRPEQVCETDIRLEKQRREDKLRAFAYGFLRPLSAHLPSGLTGRDVDFRRQSSIRGLTQAP